MLGISTPPVVFSQPRHNLLTQSFLYKIVPTPDPAFLDKDKGSPTTLVWNYPPGVPTPNPALLVEVAPPHDEGSPTTLKWGNLQTQPSDPAKAAPAPGPIDPDKGSPTTLKWNFPPGIPTPDPVLLTQAVPDTISWGYPPGVPTPGEEDEICCCC